MKKAILAGIALIFIAIGTVAEETKKEPVQVLGVRRYLQAIFDDDIAAFSSAHTKMALEAYKQQGGMENLFGKAKVEIPKKFNASDLSEFTFTAKRSTHATPAKRLELDGEYYLVMANTKRRGIGMFVEFEDGKWKVTVPKYKTPMNR